MVERLAADEAAPKPNGGVLALGGMGGVLFQFGLMVFLLAERGLCGRETYGQAFGGGEELILQQSESEDGDNHCDAGAEEAPLEGGEIVPAALAERTADERRDESAEVDAHVENGESGILTIVAMLVEVANHCRDVGLEETVTDDESGETGDEQETRHTIVDRGVDCPTLFKNCLLDDAGGREEEELADGHD